MEQVSIEEARRGLGEIVDRARLAYQPTLITRQGKPAAVVVNLQWYEKASNALREQVREGLNEISAKEGRQP